MKFVAASSLLLCSALLAQANAREGRVLSAKKKKAAKAPKAAKSPKSLPPVGPTEPPPPPVPTCDAGYLLHELTYKVDTTDFGQPPDASAVFQTYLQDFATSRNEFLFAVTTPSFNENTLAACVPQSTRRFLLEDKNNANFGSPFTPTILEYKYVVDGVTIVEKVADGSFTVADADSASGNFPVTRVLCLFNLDTTTGVPLVLSPASNFGYDCGGLTYSSL